MNVSWWRSTFTGRECRRNSPGYSPLPDSNPAWPCPRARNKIPSRCTRPSGPWRRSCRFCWSWLGLGLGLVLPVTRRSTFRRCQFEFWKQTCSQGLTYLNICWIVGAVSGFGCATAGGARACGDALAGWATGSDRACFAGAGWGRFRRCGDAALLIAVSSSHGSACAHRELTYLYICWVVGTVSGFGCATTGGARACGDALPGWAIGSDGALLI
jgi:hypothetical protein